MTKISAILPTYNRANVLGKAIESILNQTLHKSLYEIIVVDNGSRDDTEKVVHKYVSLSENVQYVLETKAGLTAARHAGAHAAKGEILSFTDDDAVYDSRWLGEMLKVYALFPNIAAAGGKIIVKWDKEPPKWVLPYEDVLGKLDHGTQPRILREDEYINGGNYSIRKDVLFKLGGFNPEQYGDYYLGDGETGLCKKIQKAGLKIGWAPDAICWHWQKVDENATLKDMKRRFMNNGASAAYSLYHENRPCVHRLLLSCLRSFGRAGRHKCMALAGIRTTPLHRNELLSGFHWRRSTYLFSLASSKKLRNFAEKTNWIE